MKIVNVMISRVMGGIEQAFLYYNAAFESLGYEVLSVIDKKSAVINEVQTPKLSIKFEKYNPLLILKLYFALKKFMPDMIIVHQKKAIPLFKIAAKMLGATIIGVAHNPKIKRLEKCDAVFSVTQNQKDKMITQGLKNVPVYAVPNMIKIPAREPKFQPFHTPIIVGTMGRFEPIKGFCDIFVLPSLEESFGMVLLEAALAKKPLICSDAAGPNEVWANTGAALVFERGNAEMLADKLAEMAANPIMARNMSEKAYRHVKENYGVASVAKVLKEALDKVTKEEIQYPEQ
ncbi:MAG: glycosyltransferase family 4 protein [Alphaproteobacteria bacterium]|nr:glycosyltransferase family 4 protein [Alphaproteobacteria bacterium]